MALKELSKPRCSTYNLRWSMPIKFILINAIINKEEILLFSLDFLLYYKITLPKAYYGVSNTLPTLSSDLNMVSNASLTLSRLIFE